MFEVVSQDELNAPEAYRLKRLLLDLEEDFSLAKHPENIFDALYDNEYRRTVAIAYGSRQKMDELAERIREALPIFRFRIREKM